MPDAGRLGPARPALALTARYGFTRNSIWRSTEPIRPLSANAAAELGIGPSRLEEPLALPASPPLEGLEDSDDRGERRDVRPVVEDQPTTAKLNYRRVGHDNLMPPSRPYPSRQQAHHGGPRQGRLDCLIEPAPDAVTVRRVAPALARPRLFQTVLRGREIAFALRIFRQGATSSVNGPNRRSNFWKRSSGAA